MIAKSSVAGLVALAICAAGPAAAGCQLQKLAELPVTMEGLQPTITAKINGKDAIFLVDSGAFYSVMLPYAVAEHRLSQYPAPMGFYLRGVGGDERNVRIATVAEFTYAGVPLKNVEFLVAGHDLAPGAVGLIGQNVLNASDVEYDLANGVIRLFKSKDCDHANLAYWAAGKSSSVLVIAPTTPREPHLMARATVDGHPIKVMFDTGAATSVLSLPAAARAGVTRTSQGVEAAGLSRGFGSRQLETSIAPFDSFAIGSEEIQHTRLRTAPMELGEGDMLLGADFFLSHRIIVSTNLRRLFFTYNGGPVFRLDRPAQTVDVGAAPAVAATAPGAPQSTPTTAEAFSRRGSAEMARRDFTGAIADFTRAVDMEPTQPGHYYNRAMAHLSARQPVQGMADLDQVLKQKPDDIAALVMRGEAYLARKDLTRAQADFETALRVAPTNSSLPVQIGGAYTREGFFEPAIRQYDGWVATHPKDDMLPGVLGARCWTRGVWGRQLEAALSDCDGAIKHGFKVSEVMGSRGLVLLRLGRLDEAIAQYDAAIRLQPKGAWSLYGRGLARQKKGLKAEADADIQAATVIAPDLPGEAQRYGLTADAAPAKS